ncbi:hydroxyalkanoic acid synthase [Sutcliffiella cohnii]|uniref:Hydroxyalkanoic acid synthase n=1 Tax=Sutcliffiella cohnii TaxID=33932 RepID=A0A223KUA0_9BACI|nr:alpha/beta fold hydrolase [Sutcliffiella cohnii]AST93075.1 hydroxyalkanoic acid synthase [Sutcliffiella cohnii]
MRDSIPSNWRKSPSIGGPTARKAIWKKNKATLWYYPSAQKTYKEPLFLIYSLVNQPFILDLYPGASMIESFVQNGYDVYLLDFGIPGYEDSHITIDHYIVDYIQKGVQRTLRHAKADEITLIGYCLGGVFATLYAAIATESIKNLILVVTPIDFSELPSFNRWLTALRDENISFDHLFDAYGVLPAPLIEAGIRSITVPVYYTQYLALLQNSNNKEYVERWKRFNDWTKGHIPFVGQALKQFVNDYVRDNKLVNGEIKIKGKNVLLKNIDMNLLVVAAKNDELVPPSLSEPIMNLVSSNDKQFQLVDGGHTTMTAKKGALPNYLQNWLPERSTLIGEEV